MPCGIHCDSQSWQTVRASVSDVWSGKWWGCLTLARREHFRGGESAGDFGVSSRKPMLSGLAYLPPLLYQKTEAILPIRLATQRAKLVLSRLSPVQSNRQRPCAGTRQDKATRRERKKRREKRGEGREKGGGGGGGPGQEANCRLHC